MRKPESTHCDKLPVFAVVKLEVQVCLKVIYGRIY